MIPTYQKGVVGTGRPRRSVVRDAGSASVEMVVFVPLLFIFIFAVVQGGLWFHARSVALGAAQEGARVAAAEHSTGEAEDQDDLGELSSQLSSGSSR